MASQAVSSAVTSLRHEFPALAGGRLYKKRNLHWIIQYYGKINIPGPTYKWLTLWELDKFIKMGYYVGPHLRSILSLI